VRSSLILALVGSLLWLVGCGGGGSTPVGVANITVTLTPSTAQTVKAGATLNIVASVANDPNGAGVNWSITGVGTLTNETTSSVTYAAPSSVTSNQSVTVTAASVTNSAATASLQITVTPSSAVSVTFSPGGLESLTEGQTLSIKATVSNSTSQSVTWSLIGPGTLTPSDTANPVTYNAPTTVTAKSTATLTATSTATGNPKSSLSISVYAPDTTASGASAQNVTAVAVDGGGNTIETETGTLYPDAGFVSVTVCFPGTQNCNAIDHVLLDTGSYGLRVLSSAASAGGELTISLPQETVGGNGLSNCISFVDGTYLWGNVATADIQVGGEIARNIPIQVIEDPSAGFSAIPSTCSGGNSSGDDDNLDGLLANGILGIGPEPTDCTIDGSSPCATTAVPGTYYTCPGGTCSPVAAPVAQQLTNPVVKFTTDNNGTLYQLPSLASSGGVAATATGSLVFGIGTESNNALDAATVYTLNSSDNFTTDFTCSGCTAQSLQGSFIDSGSNGYFFPSDYIVCTDFTSFYCDSQTASATNIGANGAQGAVNFTIENTDTLFSNPDAAFSVLGGPNGSAYPCSGPTCSFDWGLSFFFGRNVFTSIDGQTVTGEAKTPWWAY